MNYLAHVYLSRHTPETVTGGLLGDFVKGSAAMQGYPRAVREEILLHRRIDRYTDDHARVRASRALISGQRRRFAGILVDVFYDHFLACHWPRYCERPLEDFTRYVYGVLLPQQAGFPARLQRILPRMVADDWLASYVEIESVDAALNGIARRFRHFARAQVLADGVHELLDNYAPLEQHFLAFFPDLIGFTSRQRGLESAAA